MRYLAATAFAASLASASPAIAQDVEEGAFGDVFPLTEWAYGDVAAEGWSVNALMNSDVYGIEGEDLGEIEDVIFNAEGEVISIVAEVGGWLDIGDTHVSVPWAEVQVDGARNGAIIPVTEENIEAYDVFEHSGLPGSRLGGQITPGLEDEDLVGRAWRASELIGDYARLRGEDGPLAYGYVSDIIVRDDRIAATLVNAAAAYGPGYYGYPAHTRYEAGWSPGSTYYDLPYTADDIQGLEPVEAAR